LHCVHARCPPGVWINYNKISPYSTKETERVEIGMKSSYKVNFAAAVAEINACPFHKHLNFKFSLEGSLETNEARFKAIDALIAERKRLEDDADSNKAAKAVSKLKSVRQKAVANNRIDLTVPAKKVVVKKTNEELLSALPQCVKTNALSTAVSLMTMPQFQSKRSVLLLSKMAKEGKSHVVGGGEGDLDFKIRDFIPSSSPTSFHPISLQSVGDLLAAASSSSSSSSSSASSSSSLPSFPHSVSSPTMCPMSSGSDSSRRSKNSTVMPSLGNPISDQESVLCDDQVSAVCPGSGSKNKRERDSNSGSNSNDRKREEGTDRGREREIETGMENEREVDRLRERKRDMIADPRNKRKRFRVIQYPLVGPPVIIPGPVPVPTPVPDPVLVPDPSQGPGTSGVEGSAPLPLPVQHRRKSPIGTSSDTGSGSRSGSGSGG
jgi:hypothetical protein